MTLTLSASRCEALANALIQSYAQPNPPLCRMFYLGFGTVDQNTPDNQRGASIIQHLLDQPNYVPNTALFIQINDANKVAFTLVSEVDSGFAVPATLPASVTVSVVHVRNIEAVTKQFAEGLKAAAVQPPSLGTPLKEFAIQTGPFAKQVADAIQAHLSPAVGVSHTEMGPFLGSLLFEKDPAAVVSVEKASGLCVGIVRRFAKKQLEECLASNNSNVTLEAFENMIVRKLEYPNEVEGMEAIDFSEFGASLAPRVMHAGKYEPSLTRREPCQDVIEKNVIVLRIGAKHRGQSSLLARTFIVVEQAPEHASATYSAVLNIHKKVVEELSAAAIHNVSLASSSSEQRRVCDVYANVLAYAHSAHPEVVPYLSKTFGYLTGLLVCEPRGMINEKSVVPVLPHMSFVVRTYVENALPAVSDGAAEDQKLKPVSLEIADTVIVNAKGHPAGEIAEFKTKFSRELDQVVFKPAEVEDAMEDEEVAPRNLRAITRSGQGAIPEVSRAQQREEGLRELYRAKHDEWVANGRRSVGTVDVDAVRTFTIGQLALGDLSPYGERPTAPEGLGPNMLRVHVEKRVAWMPIAGVPTPFHISTIARLEATKEGPQTRLTVIFHAHQESNVAFKQNRTKVFVRELSYVAPSESAFAEFSRQVLEIQAAIKQQDVERKQNQGLAKQAGLKILGNAKRLPNVKIRPAPAAGKHGVSGNLEIHANGLRFSSMTAAPVEILYSNVKHFIFQPSVNSLSTYFHATLKLPILVGKKKADEISFYADVMEASEAVDAGSRVDHDREIEKEQEEQRRISETNREFALFARAVEESYGQKVNTPLSSLSFDGVPHRAMTKISGSCNAVWALADVPPFTLNLTEVEILSLERVVHSGINFDMKFIMKNHDKPPVSIDTIPMSALDSVKDWALKAHLYYVEFRVNLQWPKLLKESRGDPDWEPFGEGGFRHLNDDAEDTDEESGEDTDDDSYHESSDEESDEEEDSDSDFAFDETEEEDSSSGSGDDDGTASSDVSWDELERRAERADGKRQLSDNDSDDSERPKKKKRVDPMAGRGGRGGAPAAARGRGGPAAAPPRAPLGKFAAKTPVAPSAMPRVGVKGSAPPPRRF